MSQECKTCGELNSANATICRNCGNLLKAGRTKELPEGTPLPPVTVSPVEPPPSPPPRRFRPLYLIMAMLLLLLLGLLLLVGYLKFPRSSSSLASVPPTTICLATDLPLLGGIDSSVGSQMQNGIDQAYGQSKSFGDNKIYKNYQLKIDRMNDINLQTGQSDPNQGAANLRSLFQENSGSCPNPIAIIGPYNSSVAVAEIPIAVQKHILLLSPSNTAPCLTLEQFSYGSACDYNSMHQGLPNTYARLPSTDEDQAYQDARLLTNDPEQGGLGAQKIVIVGDEETYGTQLSQAVIRQLGFRQVTPLSVYCIKLAGDYKTNPSCSQLNTQPNVNAMAFPIDNLEALAAKIQGEHPDAVFFGGLSGNGGGSLRKLLGSQIPFVGGSALVANFQNFFDEVGPDAKNIYATFPGPDPSTFTSGPAKAFSDQYQSEFNGSPPGPYSANAYDATNVVIQTIENLISEGQPVTKDTVVNAVFSSTFTGVTGKSIEFNQYGDNIGQRVFTIYQSQPKGGWKPLRQESV